MPRWVMAMIVLLVLWLIVDPKGLAALVGKVATSVGVFIGSFV